MPDNRLYRLAFCCQPSVAIIWPIEQSFGDCIHHHVAGTRIKRDNFLGKSARRNRGQVADAPDVLHDPPKPPMPEDHVIEKRNQWSALAVGGHVRGTKVCNHRKAESCCNDSALAGLPCAGHWTPKVVNGHALMVNGLPTTSHQFALQLGTPLCGLNGRGV